MSSVIEARARVARGQLLFRISPPGSYDVMLLVLLIASMRHGAPRGGRTTEP